MRKRESFPDADTFVQSLMKLARSESAIYESQFLYGTVTRHNPDNFDETEVTLSNGMIVPCALLSFSMFCRDRYLQIPFDDENQHTHLMDEALGTITMDFNVSQMFGNMGAPIVGNVGVVVSQCTWNDGDWDENAREWTGGVVKNMAMATVIPFATTTLTLNLAHKHKINMALPKIRLWRGIREGDNVLLVRLNERQYHVLERLSYEAGELEVSGAILNPKPEDNEEDK